MNRECFCAYLSIFLFKNIRRYTVNVYSLDRAIMYKGKYHWQIGRASTAHKSS